MRQLRTLCATGSILFWLILASWLSGCESAPKKPDDLEKCDVDYPRTEAICGIMGKPDSINRKPLEYLDKASCFPPKETEKLIVYIHLLEDYIEHECHK